MPCARIINAILLSRVKTTLTRTMAAPVDLLLSLSSSSLFCVFSTARRSVTVFATLDQRILFSAAIYFPVALRKRIRPPDPSGVPLMKRPVSFTAECGRKSSSTIFFSLSVYVFPYACYCFPNVFGPMNEIHNLYTCV